MGLENDGALVVKKPKKREKHNATESAGQREPVAPAPGPPGVVNHAPPPLPALAKKKASGGAPRAPRVAMWEERRVQPERSAKSASAAGLDNGEEEEEKQKVDEEKERKQVVGVEESKDKAALTPDAEVNETKKPRGRGKAAPKKSAEKEDEGEKIEEPAGVDPAFDAAVAKRGRVRLSKAEAAPARAPQAAKRPRQKAQEKTAPDAAASLPQLSKRPQRSVAPAKKESAEPEPRAQRKKRVVYREEIGELLQEVAAAEAAGAAAALPSKRATRAKRVTREQDEREEDAEGKRASRPGSAKRPRKRPVKRVTGDPDTNWIESCDSPLIYADLKNVLCFDVFNDMIGPAEKDELLKLLPGVDRQSLEAVRNVFRFNPFFRASVGEYQDGLSRGAFDDTADHYVYRKKQKNRKTMPDWKVRHFEQHYGEKKKLQIEPEAPLPVFSFVEHEKDHPKTYTESPNATQPTAQSTAKVATKKKAGSKAVEAVAVAATPAETSDASVALPPVAVAAETAVVASPPPAKRARKKGENVIVRTCVACSATFCEDAAFWTHCATAHGLTASLAASRSLGNAPEESPAVTAVVERGEEAVIVAGSVVEAPGESARAVAGDEVATARMADRGPERALSGSPEDVVVELNEGQV